MRHEPVPQWASAVLDELLRLRVVRLADLDGLGTDELRELAEIALVGSYLAQAKN